VSARENGEGTADGNPHGYAVARVRDVVNGRLVQTPVRTSGLAFGTRKSR